MSCIQAIWQSAAHKSDAYILQHSEHYQAATLLWNQRYTPHPCGSCTLEAPILQRGYTEEPPILGFSTAVDIETPARASTCNSFSCQKARKCVQLDEAVHTQH